MLLTTTCSVKSQHYTMLKDFYYQLRQYYFCYTSQLEYLFRLEKNVSGVMGQNSLQGEQNLLNSLKKQPEYSVCTWSDCEPWNHGKLTSSKWFLLHFVPYFWIRRQNKPLMTGIMRNGEFCFPMSLRGDIEQLRYIEITVSLGASH